MTENQNTTPPVAQSNNLSEYLEQEGYDISPEEKLKKKMGASIMAALDAMRDKQDSMGMLGFFDSFLKAMFGIEDDTRGIDGPSSEAVPSGGQHHGGMYTQHTQRENATLVQLKGIEAVIPGTGIERTVNLANALIGFHESDGQNHGAIVSFCCDGQEGIPWCGGFAHKILPPGVYNANLSARSYLAEAVNSQAVIEPGQKPHVGDVVVFGRGHDVAQGHVGVITKIADDGTVTMVAGNSHDAVSESSFNYNNPPASLLGYADTRKVAHKKGIELDPPAQAMASVGGPNVRVAAQYSDAANIRG